MVFRMVAPLSEPGENSVSKTILGDKHEQRLFMHKPASKELICSLLFRQVDKGVSKEGTFYRLTRRNTERVFDWQALH